MDLLFKKIQLKKNPLRRHSKALGEPKQAIGLWPRFLNYAGLPGPNQITGKTYQLVYMAMGRAEMTKL